jgi:ribonuclease inhibitor
MKIILDGNEFKTQQELHALLQKKLDLPEHYGRNLDALWDCITSWIDLPLTLTWINFDESKKHLGSYADRLVEMLQEAEQELGEFKVEIRSNPSPSDKKYESKILNTKS